MKNEANKFIENYYLTEGALSKLEQNIGDYQSVMDTFKGKEVDGLDAVKEYMDYVQQIDDLSHQLAMNGASPEVKRTLMKMQSRYNAVFDPIKEAEAANKKWRDIAQSLGPDELYDPRQLTYEYLLGKNSDTGEYNYNGIFQHIDAGTARKEVENVAKELADQIFTNGNSLPLQRLNNAGVQSLLRYGVDINDYNAVLNAISQGEGKRTPENLTDKQKLLYGIVEDIVNQKDLDSYGLTQEQKDRYWNIAAEGLASAIGTPKLYTPPEPKVTGNGGGKKEPDKPSQTRYRSSYNDNPQSIVTNTMSKKQQQETMWNYAYNADGSKNEEAWNMLERNNLQIFKKGHSNIYNFLNNNADLFNLLSDDVYGVRVYNSDDLVEHVEGELLTSKDGKIIQYIQGKPLTDLFNEITKQYNVKNDSYAEREPNGSTEQDAIFRRIISSDDKTSRFVKFDGSQNKWIDDDYKRKTQPSQLGKDKLKSDQIVKIIMTPQGVVLRLNVDGDTVHVLYDNKNDEDMRNMTTYLNRQNAYNRFMQQNNYLLYDINTSSIDMTKLHDAGIDPKEIIGSGVEADPTSLQQPYNMLVIKDYNIPFDSSNPDADKIVMENVTYEEIESIIEFLNKMMSDNKTTVSIEERRAIKNNVVNQLQALFYKDLDRIRMTRDYYANNIFRQLNVQDATSKGLEQP